ncbi:UPF0654 protein C22G7.11c [Psilocybe cubensis]|uniref:UPF0654 protein C22G7.11c n=2 Tax=Psilocybe cubensis TaxID=181762 RepID=A0ACB8HEW5_PSICU|nr:UPF0654 protein C22G7.11c [Psilocybe cubensis]KAH9486270.1 UPF0654 protein C22G7.11c [Psilocybe cubensis]
MAGTNDKNQDYVTRGLKAAIHNDNVSDEAKKNAAQRLKNMGSEVPSDFSSGGGRSGGTNFDDSRSLNPNQERGYKSVLSRDNTSNEAKDHARAMLAGDEPGYTDHDAEGDAVDVETSGKETNRVLGGYKATLKNPNVSDQAKQHAEDVLREACD